MRPTNDMDEIREEIISVFKVLELLGIGFSFLLFIGLFWQYGNIFNLFMMLVTIYFTRKMKKKIKEKEQIIREKELEDYENAQV